MTREEAIRRIKAWNLDSDDMEVLAVVIPELAESEEDSNIVEELHEYFRYLQLTSDKEFSPSLSIDKILNWLESLPLNLKKKNEDVAKLCSNEWSEEDELMMKAVIGILDESDHPKLCHWLKSLRPSWKPSEEQKEALEYVIRDYREDGCNATANYLQEVLDHLKNM